MQKVNVNKLIISGIVLIFVCINLCWWAIANANTDKESIQVNGFSEHFYEKNEKNTPSPNNTVVNSYGDTNPDNFTVDISDGKAFFTRGDKVCKDSDETKNEIFNFTTSGGKYHTRNWTKGREEATLENIAIDGTWVQEDGNLRSAKTKNVYFFDDKDGIYSIFNSYFILRDSDSHLFFKSREWHEDTWDEEMNADFYFKLIDKNDPTSTVNLHFYKNDISINSDDGCYISRTAETLKICEKDEIVKGDGGSKGRLNKFLNKYGVNNLFQGIKDKNLSLELYSMVLDTH